MVNSSKKISVFRWGFELACKLVEFYFHNPEFKRKLGGWEYKNKFYPDYLSVGGASFAIFKKAQQYCNGIGIDIGAGYWPLPGALPVDNQRGPGVEHIISDFEENSLDYVFSSHCLEHIEESQWREALLEWISKLKNNGILFLYLPHPECEIWHPGTPFVGDSHKWIPTPQVIKDFLTANGLFIIEYDDGPDAMQSFYVCAQKSQS